MRKKAEWFIDWDHYSICICYTVEQHVTLTTIDIQEMFSPHNEVLLLTIQQQGSFIYSIP